MDSITMIAIAQVCVSVYAASRSSGPGIGGLLAAQTKMLVEITKQISIINQKLDVIFSSLKELKGIVEKVPKDTAVETVKLLLDGQVESAVQLLIEFSDYQERYGRENAIFRISPRTESLLRGLTDTGKALVTLKSEAFCPIVAAAWHIELQVLGNCIPFDDIRIVNEAKYFDRTFTSWIASITSVIEDTDKNIVAIRDGINNSQSYIDYDCYNKIRKESKDRTFGHENDGSATRWTVSAMNQKLTAKPASGNERLQLYRKALETLTSAGIQVNKAYMEIQPIEWTDASKSVKLYDKEDLNEQTVAKTEAAKVYQNISNNSCKDSLDTKKFTKEENARLPQIEPLFLKMLVYGHYLLVCKEGQRSARAIIERAPQLMAISRA